MGQETGYVNPILDSQKLPQLYCTATTVDSSVNMVSVTSRRFGNFCSAACYSPCYNQTCDGSLYSCVLLIKYALFATLVH